MKLRNDRATRLPDMAQDGVRGKSGPDLIDLARLRVAQVHRCLIGQTHYAEKLRRAGESSARIERVESWPVSLVFTRKERTALALAELLAQPESHQSPALAHLLEEAQQHLSRAEILRLVVAVEAMQEWNKETAHA